MFGCSTPSNPRQAQRSNTHSGAGQHRQFSQRQLQKLTHPAWQTMANQHDNAMCFVGAAGSHAQEAYCQAKQYIDNTTCIWMLHLLPIRWRMAFSRHVRLALMRSCIHCIFLHCVPKRVSNNSVYVCMQQNTRNPTLLNSI